jgi:hypothetical protein
MACEGRPRCPTYADALAELRELRKNPREWGHAETGPCNGGHYVWKHVWYMSVHEYFDANGTMVGASTSVDNLGQFCDGKSGFARYGVVPECARAPSEIVLDGGPR